MSFKKTLVALVVLAIVAAVFFWFEKPRQERAAKDKEAADKALTLDWDKLESITIQAVRGKTVIKKKGEDAWEIVDPIHDEADKYVVQGMVSQLRNSDAERVVEDPQDDLSIYGLKRPRLTLVFEAGGETQTLLIGADQPLGNAVFAQRAGENRVLVLSNAFRDTFDVDPFKVRDKSIFPKGYDTEPVRLELLENGVTTYVITKSARNAGTDDNGLPPAQNGHWAIEAPERWWRADEKTVSKMLQALRELNVESIVTEKADRTPELGLDHPAFSVIARYGGDEPKEYRIDVGINAPHLPDQRYAVTPKGYTALVKDETLARLRPSPIELKDKTLNDFNLSEVRRVRLQRGSNEIMIRRSAEEPFTADGVGELDDTRILDDLRRLVDLAGTTFVAPESRAAAETALASPGLSIEMFGDEDRLLARVTAAKAKLGDRPDVAVARGNASDALLEVDPQVFDGWPETLNDWVMKTAPDAGTPPLDEEPIGPDDDNEGP